MIRSLHCAGTYSPHVPRTAKGSTRASIGCLRTSTQKRCVCELYPVHVVKLGGTAAHPNTLASTGFAVSRLNLSQVHTVHMRSHTSQYSQAHGYHNVLRCVRGDPLHLCHRKLTQAVEIVLYCESTRWLLGECLRRSLLLAFVGGACDSTCQQRLLL